MAANQIMAIIPAALVNRILSQIFPEGKGYEVEYKRCKLIFISRWPVIGEEIEIGVKFHPRRPLEIRKKVIIRVPLPWKFKYWLDEHGNRINAPSFMRLRRITGNAIEYEIDRDQVIKEYSLVGDPVQLTLVLERPLGEALGLPPSIERSPYEEGYMLTYKGQIPLHSLIYQLDTQFAKCKELRVSLSGSKKEIEAKIMRVTIEEFSYEKSYYKAEKMFVILEDIVLSKDNVLKVEQKTI